MDDCIPSNYKQIFDEDDEKAYEKILELRFNEINKTLINGIR